MEGVLGTADLNESFWNYQKLVPLTDINPTLPVSDWTIIDIDNFLRGNPHVYKKEKEQEWLTIDS